MTTDFMAKWRRLESDYTTARRALVEIQTQLGELDKTIGVRGPALIAGYLAIIDQALASMFEHVDYMLTEIEGPDQ